MPNQSIDITALSKKYKCDVHKIIRAWKKDIEDHELSLITGIDEFKLNQIRQEITLYHERERQYRFTSRYSTFI
ncbi:MAG TPA: hypothetical protein GX687_04685 [Clostridia bacterium]|jgi:hypothetical protein|nr:hypothetical protein [Clostridia bacterium]